jgi:hypothetical protein
MNKKTSTFRIQYSNKLKKLDFTRQNTEKLFRQGLLTNRDVNQIYEGLFLSAFIGFENFLESIFLALLVKTSIYESVYYDVKPLITVNSYRVAYKILKGPTQNYIKWTPFNNFFKLAKIYFKSGKPFTILEQNEKNHLQKCTIIRNLIAHKSTSSKKKFYNQVIGSTSIPVKERQVAYYLRGIYRRTPNTQTRYEILVALLSQISIKIAG